jgi:hypothetical protein
MTYDSNDFVQWLKGFLQNVDGDLPKPCVELLKAKLEEVVKVETTTPIQRWGK